MFVGKMTFRYKNVGYNTISCGKLHAWLLTLLSFPLEETDRSYVFNLEGRFCTSKSGLTFQDRSKFFFVPASKVSGVYIVIVCPYPVFLRCLRKAVFRAYDISWVFFTYQPAHDKTYKMLCAPSEYSYQPGHPPSPIRAFTVRSVGS